MFKHILLPTDGSDASKRAVERGAQLASALGASVTLVCALEPLPVGLLGSTYRAEDSPVHEAGRAAAKHWLAEAQAIVDKIGGIQSVQRVEQAPNVYQSILNAATVSNADLIVMGTHGAGALERLIVGSQTQKVLAHTQIPVLVFK